MRLFEVHDFGLWLFVFAFEMNYGTAKADKEQHVLSEPRDEHKGLAGQLWVAENGDRGRFSVSRKTERPLPILISVWNICLSSLMASKHFHAIRNDPANQKKTNGEQHN